MGVIKGILGVWTVARPGRGFQQGRVKVEQLRYFAYHTSSCQDEGKGAMAS